MLASLYQTSRSGRPPLRIGLLLDTPVLPKCFAEVVDHIAQSDFAQLQLVVFNADEQRKASAQPPPRSLLGKLIGTLRDGGRRRRLLFALYERWDGSNISASEDPLAPVDCAARLQHVDALSVTPITKRFVHRFPDDAIGRIREKNLDVLIRFGFNILRGEILSAARCGVWSYHHGDNEYYRGGPAYFWEVYENRPISGVTLQILTEELDAGKVLYKGIFTTCPGLSQARNRIQPYWGAATFVIQKLHELHQHGWEQVERNATPSPPYRGNKKLYRTPTNWEMLRWLGPLLLVKTARRLIRRPAVPHWRLAIRTEGPAVAEAAAVADLSGFRWIESPKGRFYADPFMIEEGGEPWVFFEDFDYSAQRGRISCSRVLGAPGGVPPGPGTPPGGLTEPAPVIQRPYHLSYPCVFRDGGELYMIPETAANGTVELYRCLRFPDSWELVGELFTARAVDTTVWIEDGVYWFFVTLVEARGRGAQLWLFYSDALTGKWTPHPANPISTDVRNCRGAGAISRHNGKLFRPSQDCSANYGHSFTLNHIVVLDKRLYRERPQVTVGPLWARNLLGTHTYSHAGRIEIIDGCVRLPAARVLAS